MTRTRQVSAFIKRQSDANACADTIVFNFENPSLHGHGAQVTARFCFVSFKDLADCLMLAFQAHTLLVAAKLAHSMNRVLLINSSAPWAFNTFGPLVYFCL